MVIRALFSFLIIIKSNYCFNIDTNFPIVYDDPSDYLNLKPINKSTLFGYSVVLYPGDQINASWLLIGAPRGKNPALNFTNPGVCFKCKIKEKCDVELIPKNGESITLDAAWIGASLDISYKHGRIVTCGYRRFEVSGKGDDYYMRGLCYWYHVNDNTTQLLSPLEGHTIYTIKESDTRVYHYGQGQAGFSVHLPIEENELLLGAPGVYNWAGTSILYKDSVDSPPVASRLSNVRERSTDLNEFGFSNVADSVTAIGTSSYDLFGYSSTSGYFYGNKILYYASGAPKSSGYNGKVLIYKFNENPGLSLIIREFRNGEKFGEYFGAALGAGDVNNDGFDDLIVGAPFHETNNYNAGKVYVFLGGRDSLSNDPISLTGEQSNGQFGTCVQYLGRINSDEYGVIAVAAPYADGGRGFVYLYRGNGNGLDTSPSQRIVGSEIYRNIRGFGLSISRAADIDANRCPDVAIGAPLSGHVVLLRTRPVVTVYQRLYSSVTHLNTSEVSFDVTACFTYKINQEKANISIHRILTVDEELGRARMKKNKNSDIIQLSTGENCETIPITIVANNLDANRYEAPIKVSLTHEFIPEERGRSLIYVSDDVNGADRFCPTCPIYDKYSPTSLSTLELHFDLGCKSDVCESDLELISTITNIENGSPLILGSNDYLTLQTIVRNLGEKAYTTEVMITLPEFVNFRSIPSVCTTQNTSSVKCAVDNPLDTDSEKIITLDVDITKINNGKYDADTLNISVMVLTSSKNNGNNSTIVPVRIKREADVTISGKSEQQRYSYQNVNEAKPVLFSQTYQVEKFGISPVDEILIEIEIPYKMKTKDKEIYFLDVYPPGGNILNKQINCATNFSYKQESKKDFDEGIEISMMGDDDNKEAQEKRVKREASESSDVHNENEINDLKKRMFYISCGTSEIICEKLTCISAFVKSSQVATIQLKMLFNISSIKDVLGQKQIIGFSTRGSVMVKSPENFIQTGSQRDIFEVISLFVGGSEGKVELWIIIVSAIAGLLLLLLIIIGLIKAGFFKRKTKEELEQLKQEIEDHEGDAMNGEEIE